MQAPPSQRACKDQFDLQKAQIAMGIAGSTVQMQSAGSHEVQAS